MNTFTPLPTTPTTITTPLLTNSTSNTANTSHTTNTHTTSNTHSKAHTTTTHTLTTPATTTPTPMPQSIFNLIHSYGILFPTPYFDTSPLQHQVRYTFIYTRIYVYIHIS